MSITIDEAIKNLEGLEPVLGQGLHSKYAKSLKLGIEGLKAIKHYRAWHTLPEMYPLPGEAEEEKEKVIVNACSSENPCCDRRREYNGFSSGSLIFLCPKHCSCHH